MLIELRNVSIYERMSEETTAFNANIFVNGIIVGEAKNDGRGGCTFYNALHNNQQSTRLLAEAEAYCKGLPPVTTEIGGSEPFTYDMNLEAYIDDLVHAECVKKDNARIAKLIVKKQLTSIVVGNEKSIGEYPFTLIQGGKKRKATIVELLATEKGTQLIINTLKKAKTELTEGERILNTNIPEDVLAQVN